MQGDVHERHRTTPTRGRLPPPTTLDTVRSRPLVAAAVLVTLGLTAACSSDSSTRAAKISDDLTQAASTAATPSAPSGDGFPTAPADPTTRSSAGVIYPGAEWRHAKPQKLGFDPTVMNQIARAARPSQTTCLLVARKGRIVGEWNWRGVPATTPREVFSVTKSLTSTLVGLAQADGDLDIDQRASRYIRDWRGSNSAGVTIRNLLSNDSGRHWDLGTDYGDLPQAKNRTKYAIGLHQQYPPGEVWAYNNAAIQTLDRVISRATGSTTRDYAANRLLGPIGMTHSRMTADPAGNTNAFFGLQTTCEDLARFGYLFLRQGRWGDDQIVPKSWVEAAVGAPSQDHNAAYGLLWWLNREGPIIGPLASDAPGQPTPFVGQPAPEAPADLFTAQGLGGQTVLVDPGSETVVVRIGQFQADPDHAYSLHDAVRFVTEALVNP